nr:hypothetical protein [Tanacetum cinerariifolium]
MGNGDGFLWERVWEVMGSSWSNGGVVRSGEEAVVGLAGENGVNSVGLNVREGGRQGGIEMEKRNIQEMNVLFIDYHRRAFSRRLESFKALM